MNKCLRPGQEIAVAANAIAVALAKNLTPTEENVIGNLIVQVGSTLLSIAAIDDACENSTSSDTSSNSGSVTDSGSSSEASAVSSVPKL